LKNFAQSLIKFVVVITLLCYPGINFLYKNHKNLKLSPEVKGQVEAAETSETPTPSVISTKPAETLDKNVNKAEVNLTENVVNLIIPKINLVAPIIESGKTEDGSMFVPPDNKTVGLWQYGVKPGEVGSAVVAGHFKINTGKPGVFYDLQNVDIGDEIDITYSDGRALKFEVQNKETYKVEDFPLSDFFGLNDAKRLNLITCAGKYDRIKKDYTHRLAIFAVLKE
jgi:sortase (surface protein transpeptidase)